MESGCNDPGSVFESEMIWLEKIIGARLKDKAGSLHYIVAPDIRNEKINYAKFVCSRSLSFQERMLLALCLAPHIKPDFFNSFSRTINMSGAMNSSFIDDYPEMGLVKGKSFGGYVPSGLTFLFLSAGKDIRSRLKDVSVFEKSSTLIKEKVIHLETALSGDPFYSGRLIFSKEYFSQFISINQNNLIDLSHAD